MRKVITNMQILSNDEGTCPFCNESNLNYDSAEFEWNMVYYPWTCPNCGHSGEEYHKLEFTGHNVFDEEHNNIEITYDMIKSNNEREEN